MKLPKSAEVVVVGGGVMGVSALYHLAAAGCGDVVLIERDSLGSGATAAAAGGFRVQFSDELNIQIALESIRRLTRFKDEFGVDISFRQWGYLFLLTAASLPGFQASVALQQRLGAPSRFVSIGEIQEMVPGVYLEDIESATFCPLDGYADPMSVVTGYAEAAKRLGATVIQSCTVERLRVQAGRIVGVETTNGSVACQRVVCTAGNWSTELAATAGVNIPVRPERRFVYFAEGDLLPEELPLTIDFATSFYFHREGSGLLLGGPWASAQEIAPIALHRLPCLADARIRSGWSGNYDVSPDHNAIVGQTSNPAGLIYAAGFSGHGFQQAPVIGEYVADLCLGLDPVMDLSQLSLDRFVQEKLRPEINVI